MSSQSNPPSKAAPTTTLRSADIISLDRARDLVLAARALAGETVAQIEWLAKYRPEKYRRVAEEMRAEGWLPPANALRRNSCTSFRWFSTARDPVLRESSSGAVDGSWRGRITILPAPSKHSWFVACGWGRAQGKDWPRESAAFLAEPCR
jgi:hypothetical protein